MFSEPFPLQFPPENQSYVTYHVTGSKPTTTNSTSSQADTTTPRVGQSVHDALSTQPKAAHSQKAHTPPQPQLRQLDSELISPDEFGACLTHFDNLINTVKELEIHSRFGRDTQPTQPEALHQEFEKIQNLKSIHPKLHEQIKIVINIITDNTASHLKKASAMVSLETLREALIIAKLNELKRELNKLKDNHVPFGLHILTSYITQEFQTLQELNKLLSKELNSEIKDTVELIKSVTYTSIDAKKRECQVIPKDGCDRIITIIEKLIKMYDSNSIKLFSEKSSQPVSRQTQQILETDISKFRQSLDNIEKVIHIRSYVNDTPSLSRASMRFLPPIWDKMFSEMTNLTQKLPQNELRNRIEVIISKPNKNNHSELSMIAAITELIALYNEQITGTIYSNSPFRSKLFENPPPPVVQEITVPIHYLPMDKEHFASLNNKFHEFRNQGGSFMLVTWTWDEKDGQYSPKAEIVMPNENINTRIEEYNLLPMLYKELQSCSKDQKKTTENTDKEKGDILLHVFSLDKKLNDQCIEHAEIYKGGLREGGGGG